jgi:hypothetical protein
MMRGRIISFPERTHRHFGFQFGFPTKTAPQVCELLDAAVIVTVVPDTEQAPAIAALPCTLAMQIGVEVYAAASVQVQEVADDIAQVPAWLFAAAWFICVADKVELAATGPVRVIADP